jgi:transposase
MYAVVMGSIELGSGAYDALRAEVRGDRHARQQHRLHAVLLVAGGLSCRAAARLLGDSPRAVSYWVRRYKNNESKGLFDARSPGRPPRLTAARLAELQLSVTGAPAGRRLTGEEVSALVARRWGVTLGARQAQRLLVRMRGGRGLNEQ